MAFTSWLRQLRSPLARNRTRSKAKRRAAYRCRVRVLEDRTLLSAVYWNNPSGGSWSTGSNWQGGNVPQPGDDVYIEDLNSGNYVMYSSSSGSSTVNSITDTTGNIIVSGGTLTVTTTLTTSSANLVLEGGALASATLTSGSSMVLTNYGGTLTSISIASGAAVDGTRNIGGGQAYAYVTGGLVLNGMLNLGHGQRQHLRRAVLRERHADAVRQRHGDVRRLDLQRARGLGQHSGPATLTIGSGITVQGGSGTIGGYLQHRLVRQRRHHHRRQRPDADHPGRQLGQQRHDHGQRRHRQPGRLVHHGGAGQLQRQRRHGEPDRDVEQREHDTGVVPAIGAWDLHGGTINGGTISQHAAARNWR